MENSEKNKKQIPATDDPASSSQASSQTTESLKQGQEAIKIGKKTSGKPKEQQEKDDKKDAEKWRNEG